MSSAAFYQWRSEYAEMDASLISEMKQLQTENALLKRMYADIAMQNELVKEALAKKSNEAVFPTRTSQ
jgi:putative transposase